jgi:predicted nucleic acid-binding protein
MTTAIDTNVIVALWDDDDALNSTAHAALGAALGQGSLVIPPPVFAELIAAPFRTEVFIDAFVRDTVIAVDWNFSQAMWRTAGRAFQSYAGRRRKQRGDGPRRLLTDFLVGAYALENGFPLLTLDEKHYQASFPGLKIVSI